MSANTERLSNDLKRVVEDAENILKDGAENASEKSRVAREKLMAAIEKAKACCHDLEEKAVAGAKATDQAIRQHPYQSIGIAFGVGILAGFLLSRK